MKKLGALLSFGLLLSLFVFSIQNLMVNLGLSLLTFGVIAVIVFFGVASNLLNLIDEFAEELVYAGVVALVISLFSFVGILYGELFQLIANSIAFLLVFIVIKKKYGKKQKIF